MMLLTLMQTHAQETKINNESDSFIVQVKQTTFQLDGDRIQFYGKIKQDGDSEEVVVRYFLSSKEEQQYWLEKDIPQTLLVTGQLNEPNGSRNFNQFHYPAYLERQEIYWVLEAEALEQKQTKTKERSFAYVLDSIRQTVLDQVGIRLEGTTSDYVKAILFSDRRFLSEEVLEHFRSIGLIHLLSISGLHIQFLIAAIRRGLLRTGVTKETTAWLLLFSLPVYGTLAGWGISVFRAIIQAMLKTAFLKISKPLARTDYWALTLLCALLLRPTSMHSIGFQLSFGLSGIFLLVTPSFRQLRFLSLKKSMVYSILISLASIPVLAFHFYEFPWVSLFANILFIPLFTMGVLPMLVVLFAASFLFSSFSFFQYLLMAGNQLLEGLERVMSYSEGAPSFSFVTGRLSLLSGVVLLLGLWLLIHGIEEMKYRKIYLVTGCLLLSLALMSERFSPIGKVLMLDVGQGESILLKQPFGQGNVLIDTGGQVEWRETEEWREHSSPFSLGKDVVVPTLKSQGIHRLDAIYLSHSDMDHVGELENIIDEIPTGAVLSTKGTFKQENVQKALPALLEKQVTLQTIKAPFQLTEDLLLLYPMEEMKEGNENSLVLYGTIGEYTWLFTGDLEEEGEKDLTKLYPSLSADVLNVGHHGSNTSTHSRFLDHIQPKFAWISSGENNSYGHPHPEVLARLDERLIETYRTDQQGAVLYHYTKWPWMQYFIKEKMTFHIEKVGEEY